MQFLQSITSLPREMLWAAGVVVALLVILIWARYGRRRYLVIEHIEAAEIIALQLGRIADAIERLSPLPHPPPLPREEEKTARRVSMSMFNR
jgi:hypothetical protein